MKKYVDMLHKNNPNLVEKQEMCADVPLSCDIF